MAATKKAAVETKALPRLKAQYRKEIVPALKAEFNFANPMQVPGLVKIVVNMGVGQAAKDGKKTKVRVAKKTGKEI